MENHQSVPQEELPNCEFCKLQPLPESAQFLPLAILQAFVLFFSIKLALILLCLGYFFSKTLWVCPMCKREVTANSAPSNDHIILRLSDCMIILSKTKFRILALLAIALISYSIYLEPETKPRIPVDRTWRSMVANCGFEMQMENSLKANSLYEQYQSVDWTIEKAVFLSMDRPGKSGHVTMKIKMVPTQFGNPEQEDVQVLIKASNMELQKGEEVRLEGEFQGMRAHAFLFIGDKVEKTGKMYTNIGEEVEVFQKGLLRRQN